MKIVQFLAILLTALALVPSGAHLFALPNKLSLASDQYFIVQNIYRGWSRLCAVLIGALIVDVTLMLMMRGKGAGFALALFGSLCLAVTLLVFFAWTYPANQLTDNWTTIPGNWQQLRHHWEYSHAANAIITFTALCAVVLSCLMTRT